ncbi:MAG: hypothetical protein EOO86_06515 [Pedobacter sp.]|nr:MAG: hypothetical protein EOO86_06515 [Pedobacter sp.]
MRKGIVLSYNKSVKSGFIKDLSGQRIRFYNEDLNVGFKPNDLVAFNVSVVKGAIVAVNIILILNKNGKTVSSRHNTN